MVTPDIQKAIQDAKDDFNFAEEMEQINFYSRALGLSLWVRDGPSGPTRNRVPKLVNYGGDVKNLAKHKASTSERYTNGLSDAEEQLHIHEEYVALLTSRVTCGKENDPELDMGKLQKGRRLPSDTTKDGPAVTSRSQQGALLFRTTTVIGSVNSATAHGRRCRPCSI